MSSIITTQLKEHRGKKRFWLEGRKLSRGGIKPKDCLSVRYSKKRKAAIFKIASDKGILNVSERKQKSLPIIDFKNDEFSSFFGDVKLKVIIKKSKIYVKPHYAEENKLKRKERAKAVSKQGFAYSVKVEPNALSVPQKSLLDSDHVFCNAETESQNKTAFLSTLLHVKALNPISVALTLTYSKDSKNTEVLSSIFTSALQDIGYTSLISHYRSDEGGRVLIESMGIDDDTESFNAIRSILSRGGAFCRDASSGILFRDLALEQRRRETELKTAIQDGAQLTIGSLAHGGGILDFAAHQGLLASGVKSSLIFAVEIEDKFIEASYANNPVWNDDSVGIISPMQSVELAPLPNVHGLIAGLPCVGASLSGRSKNKIAFAEAHDTAGTLFLSFLDFVISCAPSWTLIENVTPYENTMSFDILIEAMESLGYKCQWRTVGGNEFGALEDRKRLVLYCESKGLASNLDLSDIPATRTKESSIAEILDPIADDSCRWKEFSYLAEKEKKDLLAGKGFKRQLLKPSATKVGCIGAGYAKCRSTEPMLLHVNGKQRIFTKNEHARLKSAPEFLVYGLSETVGHQILGNSVILPAFEALFVQLGASLLSLPAQKRNLGAKASYLL